MSSEGTKVNDMDAPNKSSHDRIAQLVAEGHNYDGGDVEGNKQYLQEQTAWMKAVVKAMPLGNLTGTQALAKGTGYSASTISSWCTGGKTRPAVVHARAWRYIMEATGLEPRPDLLAYAPVKGGRHPGMTWPSHQKATSIAEPQAPEISTPSLDQALGQLWEALGTITDWQMSYADVTAWLSKAREMDSLTAEQKAELASLIFAT